MAKVQEETSHVADPFTRLMKNRGWECDNISGSIYQEGLPDRYCYHEQWGQLWIEFKHFKSPTSNYIKTTDAQKLKIPKMLKKGVKVFAICHHDLRGEENYNERLRLYKKLFREPNAGYLFKPSQFHMLR